MVARLEVASAERPRRYQWQVVGLAALGLALLAVIASLAGASLLALAGLVAWLLWTGGAGVWLLVAKFGKLLLLAAIPAWLLVRSSVQALLVRLPAPDGREILRTDTPAMFAAIDGMRQRMRGPRVHHVLLVDGVNAAIVQRPAFGLIGFPRNYLLLGLPLLESFSPDEALAVVAHEYGHLSGAHGRFAAFVYRLRISWGTIQQLAQGWRGRGGRALQRLVNWYAPYFNAYTFVLARRQEYQADAAAARLVGTHAAMAALKRSNVAGAWHDAFMQDHLAAVRSEAAPPSDLAERWASLREQPAPQAPAWLQQALDRQPGPLDTHPTLRKRLEALGQPAQAMGNPPEPLAGPSAAMAWLGPLLPSLRTEAQARWHEHVAASWLAQHQVWQQRRERLAALALLPAPDRDEQLETINLALRLDPEADHRAALADFNARHAEHPLGLFLEGQVRLAHDEEAGLALLERAIALDADATKPAAERAHRWLATRDPQRAEAWAERWRHRDVWEAERSRQFNQLDPGERLVDAELDADTLAFVQARLQAHGPGLKRAWLARRALPADPDFKACVLVLELDRWARLRRQGPARIAALAEVNWPMPLHLCLVHGRFKTFAPQLKALAPVFPST